MCVPLSEDKGILILASDLNDPRMNHGYFLDLNDKEMKSSKLEFSIGSINQWHNSYKLYEKKINFITDSLQVLRFDL
jgi:hypothetical protein